MRPPTRIRLGLWLPDSHASHHERAFAQWAHLQAGIELILLHPPSWAASSTTRRPAPLFAGLLVLEAARLRRGGRHRSHLESFVVGQLPGTAIICRSPASDAGTEREVDLDLIVCLGVDLPPNDVATSARLGVLAFGWADPARRNGLPVGFWEVHERHETTGFSILSFKERGKTLDELFRGRVPTRHYHLLNQAALYEKAIHFLRSILTAWLATGRLPAPRPSVPASDRDRGMPSSAHALVYLGRQVLAVASKKFVRLTGRQERWKVSFLRCAWRQAAMSQGCAIDNPPGRYLADPFVIRRDNRDYCFVEDFDCTTQRGAISVYELGASGATRLGFAIEEPFHLSFPFLFEYAGALFMCPESSAHRDIRIYRCVDFPLRWQLEKVVNTDVDAVDTMFVKHQDRWWMLTNMDPAQTGEVCSELYVFSADSPFADAWVPHAGNPVIFDAAYARNGGLLTDGGKIFRVSQRQGFDRYGQGAQINQIVTMTDTEYVERCIEKIDPTFEAGLLGTHHMHGCNNMTVFDSLSYVRILPPVPVRP